MNKRLFRTQFNQMENIEKQVLMESLAARYDMTFLGLHTFDRWGQSCTTGIFRKDGREFVFVPGDTVTLGWEGFVQGMADISGTGTSADHLGKYRKSETCKNIV